MPWIKPKRIPRREKSLNFFKLHITPLKNIFFSHFKTNHTIWPWGNFQHANKFKKERIFIKKWNILIIIDWLIDCTHYNSDQTKTLSSCPLPFVFLFLSLSLSLSHTHSPPPHWTHFVCFVLFFLPFHVFLLNEWMVCARARWLQSMISNIVFLFFLFLLFFLFPSSPFFSCVLGNNDICRQADY